ncbi:MAG: hypothetical protein EAZ97_08605 [Bacteroidetes bacterium]|nr:MAG: hypothetical protein EAZ97_08605 [Bacteroidota bacterium]
MKRKKLKSFEKWQTYEVDDFFGLNQLDNLPTLDQWLQCKEEINPEEKRILNKLQKFLLENVSFLNEEDLKGYFITPILNLIEFYKPKIYKGFYTANFVFYPNETEQIGGKVDYMVAQGKQIPKKPFFFLHEYKKERDTDADPLGQLLVSMLGAQFQNKDNCPFMACIFWAEIGFL